MLAKRIIPALDIHAGRVVKCVRFQDRRDAGDPVALARLYDSEGADEIIFLDITASHEGRGILLDVARRVAEEVFIPFTVGGGIRTIDDIRRILETGADKIFITTRAFEEPELIAAGADRFGSQCIVVGIDAQRRADGSGWEVFLHGGRTPTGHDAVAWAVAATERGAGEILLTSMDADGTRDGYDLALTRVVADAVGVPVIASGGAGTLDHVAKAITTGGAEAALVASLLHYGLLSIREIKSHLRARGIPVRWLPRWPAVAAEPSLLAS